MEKFQKGVVFNPKIYIADFGPLKTKTLKPIIIWSKLDLTQRTWNFSRKGPHDPFFSRKKSHHLNPVTPSLKYLASGWNGCQWQEGSWQKQIGQTSFSWCGGRTLSDPTNTSASQHLQSTKQQRNQESRSNHLIKNK